MKKIAIVYYSMSGNTDYVAKRITEHLEADLIRIKPQKAYPDTGLKKFLWGGKSAVMGEEPILEEYELNPDSYDYILFGTPVWASTFAPPIRTFIQENRSWLKEKQTGAFVCYSGGGADAAIEKLKKFLEIDSFEAQLILVDPKDKPTEEKEQAIDNFCKIFLG